MGAEVRLVAFFSLWSVACRLFVFDELGLVIVLFGIGSYHEQQFCSYKYRHFHNLILVLMQVQVLVLVLAGLVLVHVIRALVLIIFLFLFW